MAEHCCHHCQPLIDALEDLRLSRLLHAMRPYMLSSPAPRPQARPAPARVLPSLAERIPPQRSKTAAAQEARLNLLPGYRPARTDVNNNRGGR